MTHKKIMQKLLENGFQAFMVGGCVRDFLMGIEPHDIDITTNATPNQVMEIFPKTVPTGIQFGTVTVLIDGNSYEVTTFRTDGKYLNNRKPESVIFTSSIENDLSRRDFTVNAMAMDIDGNIIDPFNGMNDLKNGIIRAVGNPVERFHEDALRILRAFRFSARFGFEIEAETLKAMKTTKAGLYNISKERISMEICKILLTDNVEKTFKLMLNVGVLEIILPNIAKMAGFQQNNPYHIYDVFEHTLKSVEAARKDLTLRLAMLLHDIGKLYTKTTIDGVDHFYNHAEKSVSIAKEILTDLKFDNSTKDVVIELIKNHDLQIIPLPKYVRRAMAKLNIDLGLLLEVQEADAKAQNPEFAKQKLENIEKIKDILVTEKKPTLKDLAINGYDLLSLGFKGKEIGEILNKLLDVVIDNPRLNNKDVLLSIATANKK